MALRLNNFLALLFLCCFLNTSAQETNGAKAPVYKDFRNDSTFKNFRILKDDVAKAQIVELKNGALLVRLKTNSTKINILKSAGKYDLATQVERETYLTNKTIVRSFTKEFTFCPVYFFFSDYSDSVKHKSIEGIFVDTTLALNSSIVCNKSFYLIAEQGTIYESSLGFIPESSASLYSEKGTPTKEVAIVVKNRYYFQLHKPFPFYQQGYDIKKYTTYVKKFNEHLTKFYLKNSSTTINQKAKEFVY